MLYEIDCRFSNKGSRNEVRARVVAAFLQERPGKGKKEDAAHYHYYVEKLFSDKRIYLKRPAYLHNGFDFLICVEGYSFGGPGQRRRDYPKHDELLEDLMVKRREAPRYFIRLFQLIKCVYYCEEVPEKELLLPKEAGEWETDFLIKTFKWFFIEQDIRYWNYEGRGMLWKRLLELWLHGSCGR